MAEEAPLLAKTNTRRLGGCTAAGAWRARQQHTWQRRGSVATQSACDDATYGYHWRNPPKI